MFWKAARAITRTVTGVAFVPAAFFVIVFIWTWLVFDACDRRVHEQFKQGA